MQTKKATSKAATKKQGVRQGRKKPTLKQERFVENYIANGGNATKAAKDAGYSESSAQEIASQNLSKLIIKERIQARLDEIKVTSDEVVNTLAAQMRSDPTDILPDDGGIISQIKEKKLGHLIKRIKVRREIEPATEKRFEVVEVELYSAQSAAIQLSKIKGLEQAPAKNTKDEIEGIITRYIEQIAPELSRLEAAKVLVKDWKDIAKFYDVTTDSGGNNADNKTADQIA